MTSPPPPPETPDASSPVTDIVIPLDAAGDPAIAVLLETAYRRTVDIEVAARHLWAIDREAARLAAAPSQRMPRTGRRAVVAALTSALLVTSSSAAVAASSNTIPGDLLYGLKRTVERARLLTATSPEADARVLLDMARRRLAEAEAAPTPELAADLVDEALVALSGVDAVRVPMARAAVEGLRAEAVTMVQAVAGAVGPARTEQLFASATEAAPDGPAMVLPEIPARGPAPAPAPAPGPVPESSTATGESQPPPPQPAPEPSVVGSPSPQPPAEPGPPVVVPGPSGEPTPSEPTPEPTPSPTPSPAPGTGFSGVPTEEPSAQPSPEPSPSPSAAPEAKQSEEEEAPLPSEGASDPGVWGASWTVASRVHRGAWPVSER